MPIMIDIDSAPSRLCSSKCVTLAEADAAERAKIGAAFTAYVL